MSSILGMLLLYSLVVVSITHFCQLIFLLHQISIVAPKGLLFAFDRLYFTLGWGLDYLVICQWYDLHLGLTRMTLWADEKSNTKNRVLRFTTPAFAGSDISPTVFVLFLLKTTSIIEYLLMCISSIFISFKALSCNMLAEPLVSARTILIKQLAIYN